MADIKNQADLDALFKLAVEDKNKDAIKKLKKLLLDGEAHIPKGSDRPVFGAAPKVEEAAAAVEKLSAGRAAKKEMTAAMQAEMAAAEERAKKAAAAQKAADQKALEELQAQRAADEAKKTKAAAKAAEEEAKKPKAPKKEEPKAPAAKKNEPTKETKTPKSRTGKGTEGLKQVRTREVAVEAAPSPAARTPAPGVEVAKPSRQEQQARMEAMKRGAKKTPTVEGIAKKTVKDVEIVNAVDAEGNIVYNDFAEEVKQLKQKGSPEDLLKALRARNFKEEWGRSTAEVQNRILLNTFGERALSLPMVTRNKLGELAMASEGFKQSGLPSLPDMDDNLKRLETIKTQLNAPKIPKGIDVQISNAHSSLITASGGKIRTEKLEFRKPRSGEVGSNKPKPENPVQKVSPGFEKAKRAQIPVEARNLAAAAKKKPMDAGPSASATQKTSAISTGKRSMDEGPIPTTTAAPSTAPAAPAAVGGPARTASTKLGKTGAKEIRATLAANSIDEKRVLNAINNAMAGQKGFKPFTKLEDVPAALRPRVDAYLTKVIAAGGRAMPLPPASATASAAASGGTIADVLGGTSGVKAPPPTGISKKEAMDLRRSLGRISPEAEAGLVKAAAGKGIPITRLEDLPKSELSWAKRWLAGTKRPVPYGPKLPPGGVKPPVFGPELPPGGLKPAAELVEFGPATAAKEAEMAAAAAKGGGLRALGGKALGFLGPLFALYSAYSLMDMAKQGTVDEADQRRMRALQTFGALSGGLAEEANARNQIQQMRQMVDLAGLERQRSLDEMRQQYTGNSALDALLRGQQGSLAAIAAPSRPSIAEMMARM